MSGRVLGGSPEEWGLLICFVTLAKPPGFQSGLYFFDIKMGE